MPFVSLHILKNLWAFILLSIAAKFFEYRSKRQTLLINKSNKIEFLQKDKTLGYIIIYVSPVGGENRQTFSNRLTKNRLKRF